eukprot:1777330-Pyramimonas_sp.AAC.1
MIIKGRIEFSGGGAAINKGLREPYHCPPAGLVLRRRSRRRRRRSSSVNSLSRTRPRQNNAGECELIENNLSTSELRKLFIYNDATASDCHDGLKCASCASGGEEQKQTGKPSEEDLKLMGHHTSVDTVMDQVMKVCEFTLAFDEFTADPYEFTVIDQVVRVSELTLAFETSSPLTPTSSTFRVLVPRRGGK